ncbi:MAG: hypothetical protein AUG49_18205 [Catenulispora sp. 13_1_20CM_3_70_7]|nr:MAG: hypothetical protein AUG49_18205 [Catenulispora sp. 13_1_20CM_3_70_7]
MDQFDEFRVVPSNSSSNTDFHVVPDGPPSGCGVEPALVGALEVGAVDVGAGAVVVGCGAEVDGAGAGAEVLGADGAGAGVGVALPTVKDFTGDSGCQTPLVS